GHRHGAAIGARAGQRTAPGRARGKSPARVVANGFTTHRVDRRRKRQAAIALQIVSFRGTGADEGRRHDVRHHISITVARCFTAPRPAAFGIPYEWYSDVT